MKLILFWVLGSVLVWSSFWIVSYAYSYFPFSPLAAFMSVFMSFVLLLAGSLCWIWVAVTAKKRQPR